MNKPNWWPENPYPEDIFPMGIKEYVKVVPDDNLRSSISGCLGRFFWNIASEMIWERITTEIYEGRLKLIEVSDENTN